MLAAGTLTATEFNTESGWDYITLGGTRYQGRAGPQNVRVAENETFTWRTDHSITRSGWVLCWGAVVPTASPTIAPTSPTTAPTPGPTTGPTTPGQTAMPTTAGPTASPTTLAPTTSTPTVASMFRVTSGGTYCQATTNAAGQSCVTDGTLDLGLG